MSIEKLSAQPLLAGVPEEGIRELTRIGENVALHAGDELMHEDDEPHDFYMVVEGELEVYLPKTAERISEVKLATMTDGDCIGEYSFVDQRRLSASVRAISPARVFRLSNKDFQAFLENNKTVGYFVLRNLLGMLVRRLRTANEEVDLFTLPSV